MPRSPGRGSLFERLDPDLPPRTLRSRQDLANERIKAIKQHLEWMLNTRRGNSLSCPELGLGDINDATLKSADLQQQICDDIRAVIGRYEPRVRVVDVEPLPDHGSGPASLKFRIHCNVVVNNVEEQIELDLLFKGNNRPARVT